MTNAEIINYANIFLAVAVPVCAVAIAIVIKKGI